MLLSLWMNEWMNKWDDLKTSRWEPSPLNKLETHTENGWCCVLALMNAI